MEKLKKRSSFTKLFCMACFLLITLGLYPSTGFADNGKTITGTIIDNTKEPIIGATIVLKENKGIGTVTDVNGAFSIQVPDENTVLVISYLGYVTQEIKIGNQTNLNIVMEPDAIALGQIEIVDVGFQRRKKESLTGAISGVGKEVFENRPIINVGQALSGVMPNVNIDIATGSPDAVPSINLRGGTTLVLKDGKYVMESGGPLILVDGVEVSQSQLNQINPNDISGVSVLKDLSSAAIYGTKGNNGVILVATKSGKFDQKPVISYGVDFSWEKPANIPDILDSYTYQEFTMNRKLWKNETVQPDEYTKLEAMARYRDNPIPGNAHIDLGGGITWVANTNPYDVLMRSSAPTTKHNFSVLGGSSNVNYYVSLGYVDQAGLYNYGSNQYKRYNANTRLNAKVASWFNLGTKISYNETKYAAPFVPGGKGTIWNAMKGSEVDRNLNTPLMTGPNDPVPNALTENILNYLDATRETSRNTSTVLTISPEFIIIPGNLKVKADLSFSVKQYEHQKVQAKQDRIFKLWDTPTRDYTADNVAWEDKTTDRMYAINVYGEYDKTFAGTHNFNALLGVNQERQTFTGLYAYYDKLISPYIISASAVEDQTLNTIGNSASERTGRAVFGRLSYNYAQRYLLTVDARYDGSSKFPKDNRFQFFPTFSLGWRISEEAFMEPTRSWLDNLKPRYSWGVLGSQPGDYYPYQSVYGTGNAYYIIDGKYPGSLTAPALVDPNIHWEKTKMNNFGLDVTMLKNRLDASVEYYIRDVSDIITDGDAKYPALLGAAAPKQNSGEIRVKGFELSVNWSDRLSNGLSYRIGFNIGDYTETVVNYAGNPEKMLGSIYSGMRIGEIWGYTTGDILQEGDFDGVDSKGFPIYNGTNQSSVGGTQLFPGMVWYKDLNHDGIINNGSNTVENAGDMAVIGNSSPRYRYGITGNLSYKGFDLDFLFDGIGKRDLWMSGSYWGDGAGSKWMLDRSWRPDRTDAKFPMYQGGGIITQTGYLVDGSYIRLKQLMLGYTIPQHIIQKVGVEKLRVSLSGYNLFEISDISKNYDVQTVSDQYPHTRTISLGAQIEF